MAEQLAPRIAERLGLEVPEAPARAGPVAAAVAGGAAVAESGVVAGGERVVSSEQISVGAVVAILGAALGRPAAGGAVADAGSGGGDGRSGAASTADQVIDEEFVRGAGPEWIGENFEKTIEALASRNGQVRA